MNRTITRAAVVATMSVVPLLGVVAPALAHPHQASVAHQGEGQQLANGAKHGPYTAGLTCGGDAAVYGLETAHHGPDSGTPGKSDGCYQIDGTSPGMDVANPGIQ